MPFQPPTRPHSARPQPGLSTSLFPNTSSAASSSRPSTIRSISINTSTYRTPKEHDFDDAWDSSSDKEEDNDVHISPHRASSSTSLASRKGVPIPIGTNNNSRRTQISEGKSPVDNGTNGAGSWTSGSFQHVSIPNSTDSPPTLHRPQLSASKTYADSKTAPPPGTYLPSGIAVESLVQGTTKGQSKLPPGGSWEIVEEAEFREPEVLTVKAGKEAVRTDVDDILRDPLQLLSGLSISIPSTPTHPSNPASTFPFLGSSTPTTSQASPTSVSFNTPDRTQSSAKNEAVSRRRSVRTERRREKFAKVLKGKVDDGGGVDLAELRRLAWSGVPNEVRPIVWQLLLNYLPLPTRPRLTTLNRKRKEYSQLVDQYFGRGLASLDQQIWHQIEIDVPRTRPGVLLWSCITTQRALERILYVWAIRHPASGYVQGINDLVCPFFQVFLGAYIDTDPELFDVAHLPPSVLSAIEADSFWCLSKLLDGIQDNYISQQPGIQRLVKRMSELVKRIDAPLAAHFEDQGVEFMQFAFRWMNCLLMREISVKCTIRMWDTYLFHLYVCSALLVKYSERLREMDFQEMIIFLQCLPTHNWNDHDIELLLSESYVLKTVWQGAENHFANQPNGQGGGYGMLGR